MAGVVVDVWGYDVLNAGAGVLTVVVLASAFVARGPGTGRTGVEPPGVAAELSGSSD